MHLAINDDTSIPFLGIMNDAVEYTLDTWQRMFLYWDAIRQQGTDFIDENDKGLPPVIDFDYQVIFDGRDLDRPVNYSLARIMPEEGVDIPDEARPVIIIDPRAGHGPGVGAFKKESAVGVAMKNKHPVYFMIFSQYPVPGQTLADVTEAEIQFIEVVGRFHPKAEKPAVIGNCQAGWAAALLAADRPDITGPLFLNGSPMSYWSGKDVRNPIRYKGGLLGGIWASSFCADMGNGCFDGANLVKNFEDLNPANTWWKKKYNLYANIDTERERFLKFEKWWNGFFFLSREEIRVITRDLFVGNKLESGQLSFSKGKRIDLKNMKDPIFVFASDGDNITAPQQALNWVMRVWGDEEDIKRSGQVIIYLLHKDIGHLGIFVSSRVVKREHKQLIGHVDLVHFLAPGLYEMIIDDGDNSTKKKEPRVRFESRSFKDIMDLNEERGEMEFKYVSRMSDINDRLYRDFVSPWIRLFTNRFTAEMFWRSHPLRCERYMLSDLNPAFIPVKTVAPHIRENRVGIASDNIFKKVEASISTAIASWLDYYRDMRDLFDYQLFYSIYDHPLAEFMLGWDDPEAAKGEKSKRRSFKKYKKLSNEGGTLEGIIRGLVALSYTKKISHNNQLVFFKKMADSISVFARAKTEDIRKMINQQAKILKSDFDHAVKTIPDLIKSPEDRLVAVHIFNESVEKENHVCREEQALLDTLSNLLEDRKTLY